MKATVLELKRKKGERVVMVTAYDYPSARIAAEAGGDLILVGDSLGMVGLGYDSTVPGTMADMLHHKRAARGGAPEGGRAGVRITSRRGIVRPGGWCKPLPPMIASIFEPMSVINRPRAGCLRDAVQGAGDEV